MDTRLCSLLECSRPSPVLRESLWGWFLLRNECCLLPWKAESGRSSREKRNRDLMVLQMSVSERRSKESWSLNPYHPHRRSGRVRAEHCARVLFFKIGHNSKPPETSFISVGGESQVHVGVGKRRPMWKHSCNLEWNEMVYSGAKCEWPWPRNMDSGYPKKRAPMFDEVLITTKQKT